MSKTLRRPLIAVWRTAKPLSILDRGNKSLHHFGAPHPRKSVFGVARVLTWQRELIDLCQPEVIAGEVIVWLVVRVAPEIAVELHQYEGLVVEPVKYRATLDDASERGRPPGFIAGAV